MYIYMSKCEVHFAQINYSSIQNGSECRAVTGLLGETIYVMATFDGRELLPFYIVSGVEKQTLKETSSEILLL